MRQYFENARCTSFLFFVFLLICDKKSRKKSIRPSLIVCHLLIIYAVSGTGTNLDCTFVRSTFNRQLEKVKAENRQNPPAYRFVEFGDPGAPTHSDIPLPANGFLAMERAKVWYQTLQILKIHDVLCSRCNFTSYKECFPEGGYFYTDADIPLDFSLCDGDKGGYCNNEEKKFAGVKFASYGRLVPAYYYDCIHSERRTCVTNIELPSPRMIENILDFHNFGKAPLVIDLGLDSIASTFFVFFGQVVAHDYAFRLNERTDAEFGPGIKCCSKCYNERLPLISSHSACSPIDVSSWDPYYKAFGVRCLHFFRSQVALAVSPECPLGAAQQLNGVSSYLQHGTLYPSNLPTETLLRSFVNGQFKCYDVKLTPMPENPPGQTPPAYVLGDIRLAQTGPLAQQHAVWCVFHSKIALQIASRFNYDDQRIFCFTKAFVIAVYQRIIYEEFLPVLLGKDACLEYGLTCPNNNLKCGAYDETVDGSVLNEFSTAAYRVIHKFVPEEVYLHGGPLFYNKFKTIQLSEPNISNMTLMRDQFIPMLIGQLRNPANYYGYPRALRGYFQSNGKFGIDLFSIDVQRGRDHGLAPYTAYVKLCKNFTVTGWDDLLLFFDPVAWGILKEIYESPCDIDLFVGLLLELCGPYDHMGPIGTCIAGEQFRRSKLGDRYFYQWLYNDDQLKEIRKFDMATVLCIATDISEVTLNPFKVYHPITNPMVSCAPLKLSKINVALWPSV